MRLFDNKCKGKIFVFLGLSFMIIITGCAIYLNDFYRADEEAISVFMAQDKISPVTLEDNTIVLIPEEIKAGFIFYPGGKVEYTAYLPLMEACADKGILAVLVEMPFHLAVFDIDAAEGIQELYPEIEHWYMGGHSLGGAMAASYMSDNLDDFK